MAITILLILLLTPTLLAIQNCCPNEPNVVSSINKKCVDGSPIKALPCPHKYITKIDGIQFESDGGMLIGSSKLSSERYCQTTYNKSSDGDGSKSDSIYIVCFDYERQWHEDTFTVYAILELISVFFILLTIVVYSQVREVLDLQGVCILQSISGLAMAFTTLAVNQLVTTFLDHFFCVSIAYIIYFTMLYSFFWLNALAFHLWRTIVQPNFLKKEVKCWPLIYHAFGCGGPCILVIILVIAHSIQEFMSLDIHPGFGETKCWFKSTKTEFLYFYGPMLLLICLNITYYAWTISVLWRQLSNANEKKIKVLKYRLKLCVKLFFIMGISWIFEVVSAAFSDLRSVWVVTDALNTLQGIWIFLVLVVFRKRVIRGLAQRSFCGFRLPSRWKAVADDECEELEEELNLSELENHKS